MEEKVIFHQAKKDWEKLKKLYQKDGTTKYGIVQGFEIDGVFQDYVGVDMGSYTIVFSSIDGVE